MTAGQPGPWSHFPSTRSSWSWTMKLCSENRSSSTQETAPVRLGHFLEICDLTQWLKSSVSIAQPISGAQEPGWGGRWRVAALHYYFAIWKHSLYIPQIIHVLWTLLSKGVIIFAREPSEVLPGHWDSSPDWGNGKSQCSCASCALIIRGNRVIYSPIGFGRGRGGLPLHHHTLWHKLTGKITIHINTF